MKWLKKFMANRYGGGDQLSVYLIILSIVLIILARITDIAIIVFISYIPMFFVIYRMLSKDINKRHMENYKFAIFISPIYSKLKRIKNRITDSKSHKHFTCTNCKTTLRVPKGKGQIMMTCPK